MTDPFVVVHGEGITGPGPLEEVLAQRGRATQVVTGGKVLTGPEGVRALVLRGDPGTAALPQAAACAEAGIPILAIGAAAAAAAEALRAPIGDTPHPPAPLHVLVTEAGRDDPVAGTIPTGSRWIADRTLGPADDSWSVLATGTDGSPVLLVRGSVTVTALRCDQTLAELAAHLPDDPAPAAAAPFIHAVGAALLGRWVDRTVGRTEEEAPWGRRGPGPIPRPGLVLHPA